jgi:diguanylate cyclase (GGDEF)-like protein
MPITLEILCSTVKRIIIPDIACKQRKIFSFLGHAPDKAVKHSRRFRNRWFSLMTIDVNGLKGINGTHGHGVGEEVIARVAGMLKFAYSKTDIISRIGGYVFAVLMPSSNRVQAGILLACIREGEKGR